MKAWAVIGANYGDEGKGKMVDYLCSRHTVDLVVRFNGGAQAGHTVVTPDGRRHVFHHFGSGTFLNVPTYLSRFFVVNPILFNQESVELEGHGKGCFTNNWPRVFVDGECMVTTPWDMMVNQLQENHRGEARHGSCGVGFNQTIERHRKIPLTVRDLYRSTTGVRHLIAAIQAHSSFELGIAGIEPDVFNQYSKQWNSKDAIDGFLYDVMMFTQRVLLVPPPNEHNRPQRIVFEGAQGLLLDQNNTADFPHLTRSNTGSKNVATLANEWGIDELEAIYCTRTYLTRHGAGPLPGEEPEMKFADDTNAPHEFQGTLRFGYLDVKQMIINTANDAIGNRVLCRLAVSHIDQLPMPDALQPYASYTSDGQTRDSVADLR